MKHLNRAHPRLSLVKQCQALSLARSSFYYKARAGDATDTVLVNEIREIWEAFPFYGYRRLHATLRRRGENVNRKRVQRLMKAAGIKALYPSPRTSVSAKNHREYPYLLKRLEIDRPNHVWATDITYLKLPTGFAYLVVILDLFSRRILSWRLSNSLSTAFCLETLDEALACYDPPDIFNSDQGSQFTSDAWIYTLINWKIKPSMTGVGRCSDNIHQERFWRTLKYENAYIYGYENMVDARLKIEKFIAFYNGERPHMSLSYQTPDEVYRKGYLKKKENNGEGRSEHDLKNPHKMDQNLIKTFNNKMEIRALI